MYSYRPVATTSVRLGGLTGVRFASRTIRKPRGIAAARTGGGSRKPQTPTARVMHSNPDEFLPPLQLLSSARKSGALVVEPEEAQDFLRRYHRGLTAQNGHPSWERKLCAELNITPSTMSLLAGILRRCPGGQQRTMAKKLMLSASALGDRSATFEIIQSALRTDILSEYPGVLKELERLAAKGNDPQAMTLFGKTFLQNGQKGQAMAFKWFVKATRPPTGNMEFEGASEALVNEGRILIQMNEPNGAKSAFEKAALELDDPMGYFYLSQYEEAGSVKQQHYLLKAAASGIQEACHNLGALELSKIEKEIKKPTTLAEYGMAREWFQVAATNGYGLSMLNLATMCKAVGEVQTARNWLEMAVTTDVADLAKRTLAQWGLAE